MLLPNPLSKGGEEVASYQYFYADPKIKES